MDTIWYFILMVIMLVALLDLNKRVDHLEQKNKELEDDELGS